MRIFEDESTAIGKSPQRANPPSNSLGQTLGGNWSTGRNVGDGRLEFIGSLIVQII